jgi:LemA protein
MEKALAQLVSEHPMLGNSPVFLFLLVCAVGLGWLVVIFNRLVALNARVANAYAQIDVQFKRRYDLIPNLVEVAREYMGHERQTLEAVIVARNSAARARAAAASNPADAAVMATLSTAEGGVAGALRRLSAVAESYPDLKASANLAQLSEELTSTENKVAFARQAFNDAVMNLNTGVRSFPAVIFAARFGFKEAGMLEAIGAANERQAPDVKLRA